MPVKQQSLARAYFNALEHDKQQLQSEAANETYNKKLVTEDRIGWINAEQDRIRSRLKIAELKKDNNVLEAVVGSTRSPMVLTASEQALEANNVEIQILEIRARAQCVCDKYLCNEFMGAKERIGRNNEDVEIEEGSLKECQGNKVNNHEPVYIFNN